MADAIALLRPSQWVKNSFVLAPLVFSQRLLQGCALAHAGLAFLCFCLASSASYVFNDIVDAERDRSHPFKRQRPVAAGRVARPAAGALAVALSAAAALAAAELGTDFLAVLAGFFLLQISYSLGLKRLVVVDVAALAAGFVLRATGGVVAVGAHMSPWLFVCTFLLAMFLALGKRRHEMAMLGVDAGEHRDVLGRYSVRLLDQLIMVVAVTTIVVYILYTVWPSVEVKLGTSRLYVTVPFVVFGVFRYLFLIYGRARGGNPTDVLLGDVQLQASIALWIATVMVLLYR